MACLELPGRMRASGFRLVLGSLMVFFTLASVLSIMPVHAFQTPVPAYYLNRATTLTGETLSVQSPASQSEANLEVPRGASAYFYSQPLAEGQLSASQWTIVLYAQADPAQSNYGSVTVQVSVYSMDGTTQDAIVGSSTGNMVSTTAGKIVTMLTGTTVSVKNGDRLTLQVYAETGLQNAPSITLFYDGHGTEPAGEPSRISTAATLEETWRQDFEVSPFALSSVNRYWQASSGPGVTQDSTQYYTGSHSLHVSDSSSAGTYARYDFNTLNNPSYQGLPRGTTLSFYWLSTANGKGTGILSIHLLILDQGQSYEFYWYWSGASSSKPPSLYTGTSKSGGTYMGTIALGSWNKDELYDWQMHAQAGLGTTFKDPELVSISLLSVGATAKPTDVYWDNLFVSSYTASAQPTIVQEGQTTAISLLVTGAVPATTYQFQFTVKDPSGTQTNSSVSYTTSVTETSFSIVRHYPDDFPGVETFVGDYNVTIRQVSPVYLLPQGSSFIPDYITTSTSFQVELVNKASYQRTETMRIQAIGYNTLEKANITINGPGSTYTLPVQADATGLIVTNWQSPIDAPTGNYTITVQGTNTTKTIPDRGIFLLTPAILQLSQFSLNNPAYQRTENLTVTASLAYPGQSLLQSGHLTFEVKRPDGLVMVQFTTASEASGLFTGSVKIPSDAPIGVWQMVMVALGSGDAYGNTGPSADSVVQFTVDPAVLQVQSQVSINNTDTGRTLIIHASITYPDGTTSSTGQASALLQHNGVTIASVPLGFDPVKGVWVGYYQIKDTDPAGLWLVLISAQDLAGPVSNNIENVVHNVLVDIPAPAWDFGTTLLAAVIVSGGALVAFILWTFPRQKCLSVELETDKVMQTVSKVQSTDFFRSIRDQLKTASAKNRAS